MSGAQPKAGNIAGCISVVAEVNPKAAYKRHSQGWVDKITENLEDVVDWVYQAQEDKVKCCYRISESLKV